MGKLDMVAEKWQGFRSKVVSDVHSADNGYNKFKKIVGIIVMVLYRLRKVFLAIPVIYYALKLARYNTEHLPEVVGINLQANGAFADTISRGAAVSGPLAVTGVCLVLMLFSRKALWPWAVSVFSLILPILILVSNLYPA